MYALAPKTGVTGSREPSYRHRESNLRLLQEQLLILFIQSPILLYFKFFVVVGTGCCCAAQADLEFTV